MNCWKKLLLITLVLTCFACEDDDPTFTGPRVESLPSQFRLTADATKRESDGTNLTCRLDYLFELKSETRNGFHIVYEGTQGGPAVRSLLADDGSGFVFNADTFGEVEVDLNTITGETVIRIPINDTSPNRFWKEQARFDAVVESNGTGTGQWSCFPLDIDQGGYVDNTIIAEGSLQITPSPSS